MAAALCCSVICHYANDLGAARSGRLAGNHIGRVRKLHEQEVILVQIPDRDILQQNAV